MHLLNEIQKVIEEDEPKTFGEAMNLIIERGWNIDMFTTKNRELMQMSAWKGYMQLIAISANMERKQRRETANHKQYIDSGKTIKIEDGLEKCTCEKLEEISNEYHKEQLREPLTLANAGKEYGLEEWQSLVKNIILRASNKMNLTALPSSYKNINVITPRCLLRRTYPQNLVNPRNGNRNNQDWHQDSNLEYGGRPMVTIWIPLQDGAGLTRPGLEWSDMEMNYFSWKHGDGSSSALIDLESKDQKRESIKSVGIKRGSIIAFNGLTFHRTLVNKYMKSHRDALLIRFTKEEHKREFPGRREEDFSIRI